MIHGKILCTQSEIKIGRIRIEADCAVDTRCLPRRLRCGGEEERALVERECRAFQLCLRSVNIRCSLCAVHTSIQRQHPVCAAELQPHMTRMHTMNLHLLGQGSLGQKFEQRCEICILRCQIQFLCPADVGAAHMQRNSCKRAREIIGHIAAINIYGTCNAVQFIGALTCSDGRCRPLHTDAPLETARLRIVPAKITVVPRSICTLHNLRVRTREQNFINRGFRC